MQPLPLNSTRRGSSVGSASVWYADGRRFDPHVRQHSFVEFGHEIISKDKRLRVPNVNDTKSFLRNFMVPYNIFISCIYALYSIFKDEISDFKYKNVSTSANLRETDLC